MEIFKDLDSHLSQEGNREEKDIIASLLPNYFNSFVLSQRNTGEFCEKKEEELCQILYRFWQWMHENKHTHLLLELNTVEKDERILNHGENGF